MAFDSPIRVLVADDEEAPREQLTAALERVWPQAQVVAQCVHGVDAWDAYLEHEPQVCFLDVRMPGMSGLDVAKRIASVDDPAAVVFVTAFGDHAVQAFDAGAVDYLMKPIDDDRLAKAVERVRLRVLDRTRSSDSAGSGGMHEWRQTLDELSRQLKGSHLSSRLQVIQASLGKEVRLIRVQDVVYFESDARYTRIVHVDGEALIRTPLKELLAQLDDEVFWQIHRSVIVNREHVLSAVRVDEGNMHLSLRGRSDKLPVSRQFQAMFKGQ